MSALFVLHAEFNGTQWQSLLAGVLLILKARIALIDHHFERRLRGFFSRSASGELLEESSLTGSLAHFGGSCVRSRMH
jgi:hypothetical protein